MDSYIDEEGYGRPKSGGWEVLPVWLYMTAAFSAYDALKCYTPSLSKQIMGERYSNAPWQERTGLATRQLGACNLLLTIVRLQAGICVHNYGAYNVALCASAVVLLHFLSERMIGTVKGSSLIIAELLAFVSFVWLMVQREVYTETKRSNIATEHLHHPHQGGPIYPDRPFMGV